MDPGAADPGAGEAMGVMKADLRVDGWGAEGAGSGAARAQSLTPAYSTGMWAGYMLDGR